MHKDVNTIWGIPIYVYYIHYKKHGLRKLNMKKNIRRNKMETFSYFPLTDHSC